MQGSAAIFVVVAGLTLSACTSQPSDLAKPVTATTRAPLPAGPDPSEIALMVCQKKAAGEIQDVLGEKAVVTDKLWRNHLYSCDYRFHNGTIVLSVKELSSWSQTLSYFSSMATSLDKTTSLSNLGQGAFQVRNGSVVVRKDWKVLLVDVTGLPAQFGSPATSASDVAVTVAFIILGCWAGD